MSLTPRRAAHHQRVLEVLACLAVDCPRQSDVIRTLVIELYGRRALKLYDAEWRARAPKTHD